VAVCCMVDASCVCCATTNTRADMMSFCAPVCPAAAAQQCVQQQYSSTSTAASAAAGQGPASQRPINSSVEAFLQKLTTRTPVSTLPPAGSCPDTVPPVEPVVSQGATAASVPVEQSATGLIPADDAPDTDAACDDSSDDCSADADSSGVQSAPFDSFLEQAQEAAALLAASAACGGTSSVMQDTVSTGGTDGAAAGRTVAVSAYHQQLDSMLQAVEQLESQLEQRAKPVRVL
jgi:hypothetical protein